MKLTKEMARLKESQKINCMKKALCGAKNLEEVEWNLRAMGVSESDPYTYMYQRAEDFHDIVFVRRG